MNSSKSFSSFVLVSACAFACARCASWHISVANNAEITSPTCWFVLMNSVLSSDFAALRSITAFFFSRGRGETIPAMKAPERLTNFELVLLTLANQQTLSVQRARLY